MKIIYRKSDLICVGTVLSNMTSDQEIELNVIPNFGGIVSDYDSLETDLTDLHLETIDGVVTALEDIIAPVLQLPTMDKRLAATEAAIVALMGV